MNESRLSSNETGEYLITNISARTDQVNLHTINTTTKKAAGQSFSAATENRLHGLSSHPEMSAGWMSAAAAAAAAEKH